MEVIALLEKQHDEMMQMLTELKVSEPGRARSETFRKLQRSLLAHMYIEEEGFYPAIIGRTSDGEPISQGYEEHSSARFSLLRCAQTLQTEELFRVRIGVLKELVAHDIEEERRSILVRAREAVPEAERQALGVELEELFDRAISANTVALALDRKTTRRELQALNA